jgi:hypothetical protein
MSDKPSELVAATMALDEELQRVEKLAHGVLNTPLDSRRNLEKAARATGETVEAQTRVGERIRVMLEALNAARGKNEITVDALQKKSLEMKERSDAFGALMGRFEAIGREAREITAMAQASAGGGSERLAELDTRMSQLADTAKSLWQDAGDGDWPELARDAEALRQQVLAVKNKLSLIAKRLS